MFYPTVCFWRKVVKCVLNSHGKNFGECFYILAKYQIKT